MLKNKKARKEAKRKAERKLMVKMGGGISKEWVLRKRAIQKRVQNKILKIKKAIKLKKERLQQSNP